MVNSSEVPEPNIIDRIHDLKDRLEKEVEKEYLERDNKAFAKMNFEGEKVLLQSGETDEKVNPPGFIIY